MRFKKQEVALVMQEEEEMAEEKAQVQEGQEWVEVAEDVLEGRCRCR